MNMNIAKIIKSENQLELSFYDTDLVLLETQSFADNFTLNFYLQTLPRKYKITKALLVIHDRNKNCVDLFIADEENSFFVA